MIDFFQNIFKGSTIKPVKAVLKSFKQEFPNAGSVEWFETDYGFEAVFYVDERETLVRIDRDGEIFECRSNLTVNEIPEKLSIILPGGMERMNYILIKKGSAILHEFILRDSPTSRHMMLLDDSGKLLKMENL